MRAAMPKVLQNLLEGFIALQYVQNIVALVQVRGATILFYGRLYTISDAGTSGEDNSTR